VDGAGNLKWFLMPEADYKELVKPQKPKEDKVHDSEGEEAMDLDS
jgi:hypothetical protein